MYVPPAREVFRSFVRSFLRHPFIGVSVRVSIAVWLFYVATLDRVGGLTAFIAAIGCLIGVFVSYCRIETSVRPSSFALFDLSFSFVFILGTVLACRMPQSFDYNHVWAFVSNGKVKSTLAGQRFYVLPWVSTWKFEKRTHVQTVATATTANHVRVRSRLTTTVRLDEDEECLSRFVGDMHGYHVKDAYARQVEHQMSFAFMRLVAESPTPEALQQRVSDGVMMFMHRSGLAYIGCQMIGVPFTATEIRIESLEILGE